MKQIKYVAGLLLSVALISSCSKWDDYKKYTSNGETIYTGKLDSVKVQSGRLRVKITGLLPADPKITRCKISWNSGADSVIYNISKGSTIDTFRNIINVPEGVNSFSIQTFDAVGNGSMIVSAIGTAYGPRYESGLTNRPVANAELLSNGSATITWDAFDTTSGAKGTWIRYTKANDMVDSVYVPVAQATTTIASFKAGTSLILRTAYLPNATCIDTFYAAPQASGVMYDVTTTYFNNPGPNFTNSDGGTGRWRIPAAWTTTDDVRNATGLGGIDAAGWLPGPSLSMEAGWGLPAIPNGKIYQTITLPAGRYVFRATTGDISDQGTKYITVTAGATPPDINNVTTSALVYKTPTKFATFPNSLAFQLASATQVAIGFQGNMPTSGTFYKVFSVKLYRYP